MAALVLIYDGAIFYSRWSEAREGKRAEEAQEAERARKTLALQGGDGLRIVSFYASPGAIRSGESANLCYGVSGAAQVRLEPAVEKVWAAQSRCFAVSPRADTEYKLTAEDSAGRAVSQSFLLKVTK
jgi:hypothetical protein